MPNASPPGAARGVPAEAQAAWQGERLELAPRVEAALEAEAAALELDPGVWQAFADLCTEQGLQRESLRPEILTPLQAMTANAAMRIISSSSIRPPV